MKTAPKDWSRFIQTWMILILIVTALSFCGCSSVKPEQTPEERLAAEQVRIQNGSSDDLITPEKIAGFLFWPVGWPLGW